MMSVTKTLLVVLAVLLVAVGCEVFDSPEPVAKPEPVVKAEPKEEPPLTGTPVVTVKTTKGTMRIELYPERAQETVKNFLKYVDRKYYDSTVFHRVIRSAIQGGGFSWSARGLSRKRPRDPIKNESDNGLRNVRGMVAMARSSDPDSATSQFFINLRTNRQYDYKPDKPGYCVFAKVIEGMEVADEIGKVRKGTLDGRKDVPVNPVFISRIRLEE